MDAQQDGMKVFGGPPAAPSEVSTISEEGTIGHQACSAQDLMVDGWEAVRLSNGELEVTVIPGRGGEISSVRLPTPGLELLMTTDKGRRPPGSKPLDGAAGEPFLSDYAGGWQLIGPNVGRACEIGGQHFSLHGDLSGPWQNRQPASPSPGCISLEISRQISYGNLEFSRRVTIEAGSAAVAVRDSVVNRGPATVPFCWGQHLVLGAPLVAAGSRILLPAGRISTSAEPPESTSRLAPGQTSDWPYARLENDELVDLREIPGPASGSHDDVWVEPRPGGRAGVENRELGLRLELEWDPGVFPFLTLWQPYGGAIAPPLTGIYGLGVEPWSSDSNLLVSAQRGLATSIESGERIETEVALAITRIAAETVS